MKTPAPNHITGKAEAIERIGDEDIYREITLVFQDNLARYQEQLKLAMNNHDIESIRRVAHSIKSNCATIGADNLRVFFATIEQAAQAGAVKEIEESLPLAISQLTELHQNIKNLYS